MSDLMNINSHKVIIVLIKWTDLQNHADVGFNLGRVFGERLCEAETHNVSTTLAQR